MFLPLLAGVLPLEARQTRSSEVQRGNARLAWSPDQYRGLSALIRWNPDMLSLTQLQPLFGEPLDSRDGIRNPFKTFSFLWFFTAIQLGSPAVSLGSSAR
jgi:hypothetical protein